MALITITWDLPPEDRMSHYKQRVFLTDENSMAWIPRILKQKGFKEIRSYRNPLRTTPQVLVLCEFDTLEAGMEYIQSDHYASFMSELREVGCTNISVQLWGTSPMIPEPLKSDIKKN